MVYAIYYKQFINVVSKKAPYEVYLPNFDTNLVI